MFIHETNYEPFHYRSRRAYSRRPWTQLSRRHALLLDPTGLAHRAHYLTHFEQLAELLLDRNLTLRPSAQQQDGLRVQTMKSESN